LSIGSKVQERLDAEAEKMKEIQKDIESQSELFAMNGIRPTELPELADFDIVDTDAPF
jgi:hypothetical protein